MPPPGQPSGVDSVLPTPTRTRRSPLKVNVQIWNPTRVALDLNSDTVTARGVEPRV